MITRAFCRCNSGHYFSGEFCPFDGWSSPASKELAHAVEELEAAGHRVSLEALRKSGVSSTTLQRTITIEFASGDSAFEAVSPDYLVVHGEAKPTHKLGLAFR